MTVSDLFASERSDNYVNTFVANRLYIFLYKCVYVRVPKRIRYVGSSVYRKKELHRDQIPEELRDLLALKFDDWVTLNHYSNWSVALTSKGKFHEGYEIQQVDENSRN